MAAQDPFGWQGQTLEGRFSVERVVGEGAFGVVYRARHLGLGEPVALKCLKLDPGLDEAGRARLVAAFKAEARLLHRLSTRSAAIVQALDAGAARAPSGALTPYLVMEWLEGETLESELARRAAEGRAPRDPGEALDLLRPALSALALAHREGVTHRDVKPANLFLPSSRGGQAPLKVLDFGIAKVLEGTLSLRGPTSDAGLFALTPAYAAPEQFNAQYGSIGPHTDVFALALVLLELMTGTRALAGHDVVQLYVASADERVRPSARRAGIAVPDELEDVLARAVAVRPEARFPDAGALSAALERALGPVARRPAAGASAPSGTSATSATSATSTTSTTSTTMVAADSPAPRTPARGSARPVSAGLSSTGEHRLATALSIGLVGLDELADELDASRLRAVSERVAAAVRAAIEGQGGLVERVVGERVTAVFGVPTASEDDAARALSAALAAREAVRAIELATGPRRSWRAELRAGLHTGRVFAGPRPDGLGLVVVGEAISLATRIEVLAASGELLASRATSRAAGGAFRVEAARVPGPLGTPLERVLGEEREGLFASDTFVGLPTAFVGRAPLFSRLAEELETVTSERAARLVTLVGEPGLGKSRTLVEVGRRFSREGVRVLATRCSRRGRAVLYGALASAAEALLRTAPLAVERALASLDEPHAQALDELFGARHESARVDSVAPDESGTAKRRRLGVALASFARALSAEGTLALSFDDAHLCDDASLDVLDELVARAVDVPLLVLLTATSELAERRPGWLEGRASRVRLELERLPRRHVERLLDDRLRALPSREPLVRLVAERAEGNPKLADETLHLLIDAGALVPSDEGWTIDESKLGELTLPPTFQGVVQARLDRLSPNEKRVLTWASVVGRTFARGAVLELERRAGGAAFSAAGVDEALARLRDKGMLTRWDEGGTGEPVELAFSDASLREVAYASLSSPLRRECHRVVGEWLEAGASDAERAVVAAHFDKADEAARAAACYHRAGLYAAEQGRHAEAVRALDRARVLHDEATGHAAPVGLVGQVAEPSAAERRVASWTERARLRLDLGDELRRDGRHDEAVARYDEARALVAGARRRAGERASDAAALGWSARIDARLALVAHLSGDVERALELARRAIGDARAAGAVVELLPIYALLAAALRRAGRLPEVLAASLEGLRVARTVSPRGPRAREALSSLFIAMGAVFYTRGQWVRAERCYRQAARVVDERTALEPTSVAVSNLAAVRFARGDRRGARELFARSLALNERVGDVRMLAIAHSNLAEAMLETGEAERALSHAEQAVRLGERAGLRGDLADMWKNLAAASLAVGPWERAVEAAGRAVTLASAEGARVYLSGALAVLSLVIEAAPTRALVRERAAALAALVREVPSSPEAYALAERLEALCERGPREPLGA